MPFFVYPPPPPPPPACPHPPFPAAVALPPTPAPAAAAAPESGLSALAATLRALEGVAARRLGSTRQQQQDLEVEMSNKMGRIDNAEREVALLRQELAKQRALRVKAAGDLDAQLAKLQDELVQSQKIAGSELQGIQSAGAAKASVGADSHAKAEASLQAQLEKLQTDLKAAADAHVDAEANLRKRRARARLEVETLLREYDSVQAAAQAEIDSVRASIDFESRPLADLRRYYGKVDAELQRLEDERIVAERKFFNEVTVENLRRRIAGMAVLRFYRPLKVLKVEQEKWEAKQKGEYAGASGDDKFSEAVAEPASPNFTAPSRRANRFPPRLPCSGKGCQIDASSRVRGITQGRISEYRQSNRRNRRSEARTLSAAALSTSAATTTSPAATAVAAAATHGSGPAHVEG